MRRVCIAAGWLLVAAVIALSVTPSPPEIDIEQGDKLGHVLAYALIMFWFAQLYVARPTRAAYAALFIAMGVGLEFVQRGLGYRSYDVLDMLANGAGVLLGWGAALTLRKTIFS